MKSNLLQFFDFKHLPPNLQEVSRPFAALAAQIDQNLPGNAEKTVALRKLLESKDCAVRAVIFKDGNEAKVPQSPNGITGDTKSAA